MLIDKTKFASDHGVKASTISGWMQRHWTKGQHYYVIGRTTMIDTEEFDVWIRNSQQESDLVEMVLKSKSGSTVSPFTKRSSSVIQTTRLTLDA